MLEVNCEREEPRMYRPSVASCDVLVVELNEREEREGVVESERLVMSMKREAPSVAVQSMNVDPVMVSVGVSDRRRYRPPPFFALHRVKGKCEEYVA